MKQTHMKLPNGFGQISYIYGKRPLSWLEEEIEKIKEPVN